MTEVDKTTYVPDVAIVITTYDRRVLLEELLGSIRDMTMQPSAIYLVDNENSPETKQLADKFGVEHYIGMWENTGGAGGFSKGIEEAFYGDHEWIWVMDDDVAVLKQGLELLTPWLYESEKRYSAGGILKNTISVYQPFKFNWDGTFFYWQYHFLNKFGIPNPIAPSAFKSDERSRQMNTMCFEGSVVNRRVVEAIGLPDARFFIYWDDTVYGYLASKVTRMALVADYCMRRTREIENMRIGTVRKLNSTSDTSRYHIMKNRGHMAQYLKRHDEYNCILFGIGTFLTLCKEFVRLFVSHDLRSGFPRLLRGMREAKDIRKEKYWLTFDEIHPLNINNEEYYKKVFRDDKKVV